MKTLEIIRNYKEKNRNSFVNFQKNLKVCLLEYTCYPYTNADTRLMQYPFNYFFAIQLISIFLSRRAIPYIIFTKHFVDHLIVLLSKSPL